MSIEIIINYLTAIRKQDNRCTRFPYFYVIRTEQWIPSETMSGEDGPGESERTVWYNTNDPQQEYDTRDEAVGYYLDDMTQEEAEDEVESFWEECRLVRIWEHRSLFFTHTDAEKHLKDNYYRYSKNAHTYIDYAFRSYELEDFFNALFDYFEIKEPWYSDVKHKKPINN